MHRHIAILLNTLITFTAACASSPAEAADAAGRPNVIIVIADDMGYGDVGVHGNEHIRTPHLDTFARGGLELRRFYCEPVCAPTRASLMTGRSYYRTGVIHTSRGGAKMHGEETTLAEHLSAAGYATGIFGKWHLGDNYPMRPQDQGFAEVLVHKSGGIVQPPDLPNSYFDSLLWHNGQEVRGEGYCTDVFFDAALEFIGREQERPFFVYLPTNAPHTPLEVDEKYVAPYKAMGLNEETARVYGMVENLDENFGRLLARLDALQIRQRTIVVFLTDNGPQQQRYTAGLRGLKTMAWEGGIRVPCFWQGPGIVTQRVIEEPAAHIDLLPTLLAACGVQYQPKLPLDGTNLWPLVTGQSESLPPRTLFLQCHRGLAPEEFHNCAAVEKRFKLVGNPQSFGQERLKPGAKQELMLYDLQADPGEEHNVAERFPEEFSRLRDAYVQWFADVQSSRQFQPGVIHIGSQRENPLHLCLYQDGTFASQEFLGWSVKLLHGGKYRVSTRLGRESKPGTLHVRFADEHQSRAVEQGAAAAEFDLPQGEGLLQIWFEAADGSGPRAGDRTAGDVRIERLNSK